MPMEEGLWPVRPTPRREDRFAKMRDVKTHRPFRPTSILLPPSVIFSPSHLLALYLLAFLFFKLRNLIYVRPEMRYFIQDRGMREN